jgi:hypothetical protein
VSDRNSTKLSFLLLYELIKFVYNSTYDDNNE